MIALDEILGAWKITECESRFLDGQIGEHPVGASARGLILYSPDGYMSLEIMAEKRVPFSAQDPFAASEEEHLQAYRSHLSYSGTYEVKDDRIIHHIELSSYPNFIGKDIERFVRCEGDCLYQTTEPFFMHGQSQIIHLVLKRALATSLA